MEKNMIFLRSDNDVRAGCIAYGLVKHQVKTKKIVGPK